MAVNSSPNPSKWRWKWLLVAGLIVLSSTPLVLVSNKVLKSHVGTPIINSDVQSSTDEIDNNNEDNQIIKTKNTFITTQTSIIDENVEEFIALGLTPHHSIRIDTINEEIGDTLSSKILHGRFLHITDMHPDPLFVEGGLMTEKCHRLAKKKDRDDPDIKELESHTFGDAMSGCDSPIDLFEQTLQWVRENLKDKIDFVIWTGDNMRHDNDRKNPRLEVDILDLNEKVADKMTETFMDDSETSVMPINRRVKIVPSLGNNDVYPHNLFAPGPTLQTREMFKIWKNFVPPEQMHIFDRGVYYFQEVIPGKLAVVSINTLYFFKSNPLNDNCDRRKEPGYKLFEWLGVTLKELRKRNIKVWLSGHVPPIPKNLHYSCYTKMAVWLHEYRDIIVGGLYGHMNIDHFIPLDSIKAWNSIEKRLSLLGVPNDDEDLLAIRNMLFDYQLENNNDQESTETVEQLYRDLGLSLAELGEDREEEEEVWDNVLGEGTGSFKATQKLSPRYDGAPSGKVEYLESVRDEIYMKLKGKKKSGVMGDRYAIAHVTASVIPTYNPGLRVWEYNVTEFLARDLEQQEFEPWSEFFARIEVELEESAQIAEMLDTLSLDDPKHLEYLAVKKDKSIPSIMPSGLPLGPAYTKQLFSPERYTQYFVDLDKYATGEYSTDEFQYRVQYSTDDKNYGMSSLLVEDWLKLGKKLSKSQNPETKSMMIEEDPEEEFELFNTNDQFEVFTKSKKLWAAYLDRAFISTGYQELFKE